MGKLRLTHVSQMRLRDVLNQSQKPAPHTFREPVRFDVRIVRCGVEMGDTPQLHYSGMLRLAEDLTTKVNAGTAAVVLADLNGAALTPDRDYLAIRGGDESDVPVYWTLSGGGSGAGACGVGCGSPLGWLDDWCLKPELVCAVGEFAGINTTQLDGVFMFGDANTHVWTAQSWNSTSGAWENTTFNFVGGSGALTYDGDAQEVSIGNTVMKTRCFDSDLVAAGGPRNGFDGNSTLRSALSICDPNEFAIRLSCVCCPIDGFTEDEKWYCIVGSGENCAVNTSTAVILSIADGSACNTSIQICAGPFDTEAEAEAACNPGRVSATCSDVLPTSLTASLTGGEGTLTLTWSEANSRYEGSKALSCGETLYLRFDPTNDDNVDGLLFSCDDTNYVNGLPGATGCDPYSFSATINLDGSEGGGCGGGACGSFTVTVTE